MPPDGVTEFAIPATLAARIQAVAEEQHRPVLDVLCDAVASYLGQERSRREGARSPAEAAARMRRERKGNVLPEDTSLRDLMIHGRA